MRTLIKGGLVLDPANRIQSVLNVLMEDGRIAAVTEAEPEADEVVDAAGRVVAPGFIDIHMHEDPLNEDGTLYRDEDKAIFNCMLRMGVTTALGGNCGDNCCDPADYLDIVDQSGAAVNVGMLAGHTYFRRRAGVMDRYSPATAAQLELINTGIDRALMRGCLGVSYGMRYSPGTNREEIIAAAKTVRAHEFISEMPDGYYTQVNERGSRLSQGQKQLIAFARTLLSDPKILVLDEATSSIDAKTERLLQEGLQALLKGRTSFIIAHRLSTIKNCDRILYISNKGIAESGSHDELMEQKGHYYQLYTAQLEE